MNIERRLYSDRLPCFLIFACIIQIRKCNVYNLNFDERHDCLTAEKDTLWQN